MRIGITGASGYVGSHLLKALEGSEAYDPTVSYDVIVHLAGENIASSRWTAAKKEKILQSRVESALALSKNPPKVLICASAITQSGTFLDHVQREWEKAADHVGAERTVKARFGVIVSPDGGAIAKMLPAFKAGLGGNLGDGKQPFIWIALADVIGGIKHCIENEISGAIDFCSPNTLTNCAFTKVLGKVVHRPTFCHLPKWLLRLLFGEMANEIFLGRPTCRGKALIDTGYTFEMPHLEMALKGIAK